LDDESTAVTYHSRGDVRVMPMGIEINGCLDEEDLGTESGEEYLQGGKDEEEEYMHAQEVELDEVGVADEDEEGEYETCHTAGLPPIPSLHE
jgi:hypothetical protein